MDNLARRILNAVALRAFAPPRAQNDNVPPRRKRRGQPGR